MRHTGSVDPRSDRYCHHVLDRSRNSLVGTLLLRILLVYAAARYTSPRIMMTQMTRAILLASATMATLTGQRANNPINHGDRVRHQRDRALAPLTSRRRR